MFGPCRAMLGSKTLSGGRQFRQMNTATKTDDSESEHINDERLLNFINGHAELTAKEEEHLRNCQHCNEEDRTISMYVGSVRAFSTSSFGSVPTFRPEASKKKASAA